MSQEGRQATTPKRHTVAAGCLLSALTVAGMMLSGCEHASTDTSPVDVGRPAASPATSNSSGTTSSPRTFTATTHPCNLIDHHAVAQLLGPDGGAISPPRTDPVTPTRTLMTCTREYGEPGADLTIVALNLILTDPSDTQDQYDNLRHHHARRFAITDIPNLGQSAYTYTDPDIGQTMTVYDGNLFINVAVHPVTGSPKRADAVMLTMSATARYVMDQLRAD